MVLLESDLRTPGFAWAYGVAARRM